MRVFVWLVIQPSGSVIGDGRKIVLGGKVIGCEASREAAEEYAREILPAGETYRLEQWEMGFSRAGPTVYGMIAGEGGPR